VAGRRYRLRVDVGALNGRPAECDLARNLSGGDRDGKRGVGDQSGNVDGNSICTVGDRVAIAEIAAIPAQAAEGISAAPAVVNESAEAVARNRDVPLQGCVGRREADIGEIIAAVTVRG